MKVEPTSLDGVLLIHPEVFRDGRGFFTEIYQRKRYQASGIDADFVQDNLSRSAANALRGLHYQYPEPQAKLAYVLSGRVFDVVVDVRRGSPTFGKWAGVLLSEDNHCQLFIPGGFAHGFCVLSDGAVFAYKCGAFYNSVTERLIRWNDPDLGIDWPVANPLLSEKDRNAPCLKDVPSDHLPVYGC